MASASSRLPRLARPRLVISILAAIALLIVVGAVFTRLYTDLLFYRSVGFSSVFTRVLWTRIFLFFLFGLLMAAAVGANVVIAYRVRPPFRPLSAEQQNLERYRLAVEPYKIPILAVLLIIIGAVAGTAASGRWQTWLMWRNGTSFHVQDPVFHRDVSYYAFTYPFQRFVLGLLFSVVVVALIAALIMHYLFGGIRLQTQGEKVIAAAKVHISVLLGLFALLKAGAYYLDRFGLMFSERGVVTGASYTDIHAVMPAKLILLVISLLCAVLFIYNIFQRGWLLPALAFGILVLSALVIGGAYPAIVQQFKVNPTESTLERPYIDRNIKATRDAYAVQTGSQVTYQNYPAVALPDSKKAQADRPTINDSRLLDPNILAPTYEQLQQIRNYYGFPPSLDVDRYPVDPTKPDNKQINVVAAREIDVNGLSPNQQNWINGHLVYTHGNGFVAAPANKSDDQGRPIFTERDVPPTGNIPITQGGIYFGELSPQYSVVHTKQREVNGPGQGAEEQATNTYEGTGGVSIGSLFRQVLFAFRFGEKNLVLSGDLTSDSRILYIRNPRDRVEKVAPYLTIDGDPYPAVINGRVTWMLDGYTTSDGYPYSERADLRDVTSDALVSTRSNRVALASSQFNYIRNSVKATVDAYDGTVTLYAFDPQDPVLQTWMKIFPGTVKPLSDLQANKDLMAHLRYPEDLFKAQRNIVARYHVDDAGVFYTQEDSWQVPEDPTQPGRAPQPPHYQYAQMPLQSSIQFNLTSALVANKRPNMSAYMYVSSDPGPDYGKIRVLALPKQISILGPVQVQNQIESNPVVSRDLSLLRSGGSSVDTGNLLTLPVGAGLLYVEPIYVQASGGGGYPTLRKVAMVFGDRVGYGSFEEALTQVFGLPTPTPSPSPSPGPSPGPGPTPNPEIRALVAQAQKAYNDAQAALKNPNGPDWTAYGDALKRLQTALTQLAGTSGQATTASPAPSASATPATPATPSPALASPALASPVPATPAPSPGQAPAGDTAAPAPSAPSAAPAAAVAPSDSAASGGSSGANPGSGLPP